MNDIINDNNNHQWLNVWPVGNLWKDSRSTNLWPEQTIQFSSYSMFIIIIIIIIFNVVYLFAQKNHVEIFNSLMSKLNVTFNQMFTMYWPVFGVRGSLINIIKKTFNIYLNVFFCLFRNNFKNLKNYFHFTGK